MTHPRFSVIGIGEDGLDGLTITARQALADADLIAGAPRHLELIGDTPQPQHRWTVPFDESLAALIASDAQNIAMLVSGDPFWFGAGSSLSKRVPQDQMRVFPAPSVFNVAAARLGWPLERVTTLGLHAKPLPAIRPYLSRGGRLIVTLRDGAAVPAMAGYLSGLGLENATCHVLERLGGPKERIRVMQAEAAMALMDVTAPVALALELPNTSAGMLPRRSGLPDDVFEHDGQMTKRVIRAATLSALAPRGGECLWDIGLGSGSIALEWLLADPRNTAVGFEANPTRAARAARNAAALGQTLQIVEGRAPDVLTGPHPQPDVVFIGGGASEQVLQAAWDALPSGGRIVVNSVTLETEALLIKWHSSFGGELIQIQTAHADSVGNKRGWRQAMPVIQWRNIK